MYALMGRSAHWFPYTISGNALLASYNNSMGTGFCNYYIEG